MRFEFDVNNFALTNVQIKPHCCIPSETITSTFKGFLARATKISSEKYLSEEIEYLTDIFCENRHGRKTLKKIIAVKREHVVLIIIIIIIMITTLQKAKIYHFLGTKNRTRNQKRNTTGWIESSVSNGP